MYKVKIDSFEGPFDLLIYLLENAKMDIYNIRISEITNQYINYLDDMEEMDIEVGTEFILLAAILIKLKARMLLPRETYYDDISTHEDTEMDLVSRLSDYMKVKKIAEFLQESEKLGLRIFEKAGEDISIYLDNPEEVLKTSEEKFVDAFFSFLERKKRLADVKKRYVKVHRERASVEERINYMIKAIDENSNKSGFVIFKDLIPDGSDKYDLALSFVSLLEMVRTQDVDVNQDELYGDIQIKRKRDKEKLSSKNFKS